MRGFLIFFPLLPPDGRSSDKHLSGIVQQKKNESPVSLLFYESISRFLFYDAQQRTEKCKDARNSRTSITEFKETFSERIRRMFPPRIPAVIKYLKRTNKLLRLAHVYTGAGFNFVAETRLTIQVMIIDSESSLCGAKYFPAGLIKN